MVDKKKLFDDLPRRGFSEREFALIADAFCYGMQIGMWAVVVNKNDETKVNRINQDVRDLHSKIADEKEGYAPVDCVTKDIQIIVEDM